MVWRTEKVKYKDAYYKGKIPYIVVLRSGSNKDHSIYCWVTQEILDKSIQKLDTNYKGQSSIEGSGRTYKFEKGKVHVRVNNVSRRKSLEITAFDEEVAKDIGSKIGLTVF